MSDVMVQATVSFIITFRKKERHFTDIISSVADKLGSFLMWDSQPSYGDRRVRAPTYPRRLTRVTFMQGRSGCCCVGWEGWARTCDNAVNSHALHQLSYSPMWHFDFVQLAAHA